MNYDVEI